MNFVKLAWRSLHRTFGWMGMIFIPCVMVLTVAFAYRQGGVSDWIYAVVAIFFCVWMVASERRKERQRVLALEIVHRLKDEKKDLKDASAEELEAIHDALKGTGK